MRRIIVIVAASVIVFASCTANLNGDASSYVPRIYQAEIADQTKTSLDASGKVSWCRGDVVRYYSEKGGAIGECILTEDCERAGLDTKVAADASFLVAVYGGNSLSNNTGKGVTISGVIPAEQSGVFGDNHVSAVKAYDLNTSTLTFHNIVSYIKFTLTRADVAKIVFSSNDDTALTGNGELDLTFTGETISAAFGMSRSSSITVNNGGAGTFYIATLPCTMASGFKVDCYDAEGVYLGMAMSEKSVEVGSGTILNLGVIDSHIEKLYEDLGAAGTANCYIVSKSGNYKFNAGVKGNSSEPVDGTPYKAKVLWETFGNNETPNVGDVVSDVTFMDGYIRFHSGRNGNAVIAVKDIDDEILWSWHIWVCDGYDPAETDQTYGNNAGIMMDRNLGAISATPGDVGALGLMYQWGRKDPFLNGGVTVSPADPLAPAGSTIPSFVNVDSDAHTGTIGYSIANPTTYIVGNDTNHDWLYTGTSECDNTRWASTKTKYDPCPRGYRVADGGQDGVWNTACGGRSADRDTYEYSDNALKGTDLKDYYGTAGTCWYPATGFIAEHICELYEVGSSYSYWSSTPISGSSSVWTMYSKASGIVGTLGVNVRCAGLAVRCLAESSPAIVPADAIAVSETEITIPVGQSHQLSATISPANANVQSVIWKASASNISVDQTGLVTANKRGKCRAWAYTWDGKMAECWVTTVGSDLSSEESANSYIVPTTGYYSFRTVKGNTDASVGAVASAAVLWESFGTSETPSVGDLVSNVTYSGGYVSFKATDKKGNAVIAAKDADGNILWSWHIWLTDKPVDQVYNNNAGTMMDRNLGATSATKGDVHALGLMYQWGRKDPFLGADGIESLTRAASTITWPEAVDSDALNGTIAYVTANPTTFIGTKDTGGDWYYADGTSSEDTRWQTSASPKGVYDPCPAGYRVPDGGDTGIWSKVSGVDSFWKTASNWDGTNRGMDFGSTDITFGSGNIWYPAAGFLSGTTQGALYNVGYDGLWWSCTPALHKAYDFNVTSLGGVFMSLSSGRAYGYPVRCVKE